MPRFSTYHEISCRIVCSSDKKYTSIDIVCWCMCSCCAARAINFLDGWMCSRLGCVCMCHGMVSCFSVHCTLKDNTALKA
jgi:hypothetical protein